MSQLWAIVWANQPEKIVEETGALFDDVLEPVRTYGPLTPRGWRVVPCTKELERQYRALHFDDDSIVVGEWVRS